MNYLIVVVSGFAFGFLLPARGKAAAAAFLLGVGFLLTAVLFAVSFSYNTPQITDLFLMLDTPRPGLAQLIAVGYGALFGASVAAGRLFLKRSNS
jgi:hypothetical protein